MDKRYLSISIIRLLCALTVFAYHFVVSFTMDERTLHFLYYAVHAFLFISGFLYAGKRTSNVLGFYKKNAIKILVPVIYFVVIAYAIVGILQLCGINVPLLKTDFHGISLHTLSHLWYVYAILICYAITPFMHAISGGVKINRTLSIIVVVCSLLINLAILPFGARMAILPFYAGWGMKLIENRLSIAKKLALFIFLAIVSAVTYLLSVNCQIVQIYYLGRELSGVVFASSMCALALTAFNKIDHVKTSKLLRLTDRFSYTFFITHHIFLLGGFSVFYQTLQPWLILLISFTLSVVTAIGLELLSSKTIRIINNKK